MLKLIILTSFFFVTFFGCSDKEENRVFNDQEIIKKLESNAHSLDSYAQDYIIKDKVVKRMYFLFEKTGKSIYTFRSEYLKNGKQFICFSNVNGEYDFDYYPDEKLAIRYRVSDNWNETNYSRARKWHFNYSDSKVIGETIVDGKDCYVLNKKNIVITIWKEKGIPISLSNKGSESKELKYGNFAFNLDSSLFVIPNGTRIIDR